MSEVVNAHVQAVMALPIVYGSNTQLIHEFYEKLLTHVETMGKFNNIDHRRDVRNTLEKLPQIRLDLVRLDVQWQHWDFPKLIYALRKWVERNPITGTGKEKPPICGDKNLYTRQQNSTNRKCMYCDIHYNVDKS